MSCPLDGLVEIRIVEDDGRALSTQLKGNILQVALGSGLHDFPADEGRTSERDLFDTAVLADGLTDSISISDNEVEDTRRETDFTDHVGDHESGQGSQFGGLHDDDVSGSERGADLPAQHQD